MSFTVLLSDDALEDFEDVIDYYELVSETVCKKFIMEFDKTISILSKNPYYQIRYDNIRLKQVKGFSILLHFIVYAETQTAIIYGVRHGKQNPENYPKP
nr:type II toxin-antitoxin system RelE/ParE family toxin [Elizabethkingia sp. ASV34]